MGPSDVSPFEMSDFHDIKDAELDALIAGQISPDDPRLGSVARFVADFDEAHPEPSTECYEAQHMAQIMDAALLMAANGDPAAMPASKADGPAQQVSGLPKPRRSRVMKSLLGAPLWAKITASAVAVLLSFTGVAFAGGLPDPVQGVVHDAVGAVGIDIPDAASDEAATAADVDNDVDNDADEAAEPAEADDDTDEAAAASEADDADEAADVEDADEADESDDQDEAVEVDDDYQAPARAEADEADDDDSPATTVRTPASSDDEPSDDSESGADSESESD